MTVAAWATCAARPQLKQLISDINSYSDSPEALKKLKELQFVPKHAVKESLQDIVQCINGMLQHATSGSVRDIRRYLFTISTATQAHPALLEILQTGSYRTTILGMTQACAEDGAVYKKPNSVSQLSSAQYNLVI